MLCTDQLNTCMSSVSHMVIHANNSNIESCLYTVFKLLFTAELSKCQ